MGERRGQERGRGGGGEGQGWEGVEGRDLNYFPFPSTVQLYTYQRSFMTKFSLLYSRLEVELLASHQRMREAFSKVEVTESKEKQSLLDDYNAVSE